MITIGADPEFFVASRGEIVSVEGLVGGTKDEPRPMDEIGAGFGAQEDNVMAELTIPPTSVDGHRFIRRFANNITQGIKGIEDLLMRQDSNLSLQLGTVTHKFERSALNSPQAKQFGCSPDFDAYTGQGQRRRPPSASDLVRNCGGHIHIGGDLKCPEFVAAMFCDVIISLNLIVEGEIQGERREHYGQAGAFRPKPYGLEYRTPSTWWTKDEDRRMVMGSLAGSAARYLSNTPTEYIREHMMAINWNKVREAVNEERPDHGLLIQSKQIMGIS